MIQRITLVFFISMLFLFVEEGSGAPTRKSDNLTAFCRNNVHAPPCRGGHRKRDIASYPNEEYRAPTLEDLSPHDLAAVLNSPPLFELFRKMAEVSPEYESETGNNLK